MKRLSTKIIFVILFLLGFAFYTYKVSAVRTTSKEIDALLLDIRQYYAENPNGDYWMAKNGIEIEQQYTEPEAAPVPEQPVQETATDGQQAVIDEQQTEPAEEETTYPDGRPKIDINSWEFILANADNSIAEYEPPELVTLEDQRFDSRIVDALASMTADARSAGIQVFLSSGYRSYSEQAANFRRVCENNGITDGKDSAGFYITMPAGCSEHQTGLCCDITDYYRPTKNRDLENTETYQYLKQHCTDYGFIVRFPDGKESETGVMYEPFHFRYVGVEAAKYIMENDLTLESFLQLYK